MDGSLHGSISLQTDCCVSSLLFSDPIGLFRLHCTHHVSFFSVTPAVSRTSVAWSVASLRPHRQPEGPVPVLRPGAGAGLRGKRRPRSGHLLTSSHRNYFAGSARRAVAAPSARNTGRLVVCFLNGFGRLLFCKFCILHTIARNLLYVTTTQQLDNRKNARRPHGRHLSRLCITLLTLASSWLDFGQVPLALCFGDARGYPSLGSHTPSRAQPGMKRKKQKKSGTAKY